MSRSCSATRESSSPKILRATGIALPPPPSPLPVSHRASPAGIAIAPPPLRPFRPAPAQVPAPLEYSKCVPMRRSRSKAKPCLRISFSALARRTPGPLCKSIAAASSGAAHPAPAPPWSPAPPQQPYPIPSRPGPSPLPLNAPDGSPTSAADTVSAGASISVDRIVNRGSSTVRDTGRMNVRCAGAGNTPRRGGIGVSPPPPAAARTEDPWTWRHQTHRPFPRRRRPWRAQSRANAQ